MTVHFDQVEIREYSITVGDNPSCSSGCPISLDWEYDDRLIQVSLDVFEAFRADRRRCRNDLIIPAMIRYRTLREWDVPINEILLGEKNCELSKKQRRRHCEVYQYWSVLQYLKGTVKRILFFSRLLLKRKRKEKSHQFKRSPIFYSSKEYTTKKQ